MIKSTLKPAVVLAILGLTIQCKSVNTTNSNKVENDSTDQAENDIVYIGAMTRRVMPPPAETYHAVAPGETKSVSFDLNQRRSQQ